MWAAQQEILSTTSVDYAVFGNFLSTNDEFLVTVGSNRMIMYKVYDESCEIVLRKFYECRLYENVTDLNTIKMLNCNRDFLIISLGECKYSTLSFNQEIHRMDTVSMHDFSDEKYKRGFDDNSNHDPMIKIDPKNRCIAYLFYSIYVAITPVRDFAINTEFKYPFMPSYVIDLTLLNDEPFWQALSIEFLYGYFESTLAILHEPIPTCSGRLPVRMDTYHMIALSLDMVQIVNPIIWSVTSLPFDCLDIIALKEGSVLIFTNSLIINLKQSIPARTVSLNSSTGDITKFVITEKFDEPISLNGAVISKINETDMVIGLSNGCMYILTVLSKSNEHSNSFIFTKLDINVGLLTKVIVLLDKKAFFLASRVCDSKLIFYSEKFEVLENNLEEFELNEMEKINNEDVDIYGENLEKPENVALNVINKYSLKRQHVIKNIAPSASLIIYDKTNDTSPQILKPFGDDYNLGIQIASSINSFGTVNSLEKSIRPNVIGTFDMPKIFGMWSVSLTKLPSQFTNNANEIDELNQYTYLVVSLNTTTLILENDDDMFQVEGTNFVCDDKTISIIQPSEVNFQTDEQITPSMIAIQVLPHSIEMVTSSSVDKLAKLGRDNRDEVYTIAKTCKKYLTVLTSQNLLYIFEICCNIEENTDYINQNISDKYQDTNSDVDANLNVKGDCELNIETMERISEISESDQPVETSEIDTENLECKPISTLKSVIFTLIPHYLIDSEPGVNYIEDIVLFNVLFDTHSIFKISWTDRNVSNDCQLDPSKIDTGENVDDEEFMLYGASNEMSSQSKVMKLQIAEENENDDTIHEKMTNSQYLLFKIGKNGHLEILELLTRQPLFSVEKFYNMPIVLNDDFDKLNPTIVSNFTWLPDRNIYGIDDFHVLFTKDSDPIIYFIVLINSQIVVYKSIQFSNAKQERLNMRFVKCNLNINLQKSPGAKEGKDSPQKIVYFDDISDSYGVFITGLYPCFMFFKDDGFIYFHPMTVDGPVDFMAPFSSGVCRKGFVYVNLNHQIRISMLDDTFNYNCEWAVKNIDIYSTPRFLLYHRKTNIIGVVSSKQQDCMKLVRYTFEGDKETVEIPVDDRFVQPQVDIFQIELYTSDTGEKIPNSLHIFDLFDHILCAKEANLLYEGAHSGVKPYFTLGSNVCNGEEVTSRGRIYVMDVIEVVPEVDQPLTKYKLKIEYAEDQKGPITAIHHVNGYLVTAIGQKIYIWQYSDQDLSGVSFIDTTIYIVNISVISNLVLVADVYMSVNLLRFDSDKRVISQVCKDTRDLSIYATGFIVNDDKLAFIATDDKCNLFIYEYLPEAVESVGGTRLVCSSAVNIGLHVTNFVHVQCKRYDSTLVKFVTDSKPSLRHATYYSATDGSIGCILPISEKCYRRLLMLQNILKLHLSNIGNVNHGFYRKVIIPEIQIHRLNFRTIIDVNYLKTYMYMSFSERCEFASRIGTTMSQIIEDLTEIDRFSDHF